MLIDVKDISYSYGENKVIRSMSFDFNSKDFLCVVGENGSGKSTLLKGILSLKTPVSGSVLFSTKLRRNEIAYLPQLTTVQKDFPASVKEIVLSGRLSSKGWSPFYTKNDKRYARETMDSLNISNLSKKSFRELSGGQQRRVLLARAICSDNKAIFLDEPTAGLDPIITDEFYRILKKKHDEGLAIFLVTHDIVRTIDFATHVLYIRNGNAKKETVEEFKESKQGKILLGEKYD